MKVRRLLAFGGALICLGLAGCVAGAPAPTAPSTATTAAPIPGSEGRPESSRTGRSIVATSAAWTTPTGRISCRSDATSVRCEPTTTPTWSLDPPANCRVKHPTALRLTESGVDIDCSDDSTVGAARLGTGLTAWWRAGQDPQIRVEGVPQAALGYGSTIQVGAYVCTSLQVGITCADTRSGHGFELSTESVSFI